MNDPITDTADNKLIEIAYPLLEKKCDTINNLFFLGNMLKEEKQFPFIDQVHYSPLMNQKIAAEIVKKLLAN